MSSRSKEKVCAAFRKIFKSNDKVEAAEVNAAMAANGATAAGPSVGTPPPTNGSGGTAAPAAPTAAKNGGSTDSPGKRHRRQDNKVAPMNGSCSIHTVNLSAPDTSIRARRLMKEFREIQRSQNCKAQNVFTVELVNDNLYEWYARLHTVDADSKLAKDMLELNIPCILLHLVFPDNFPFAPPFMRVVEPRIEKGFVMEGGAICMELLTPRGWASAYTVEAVLMQFAASLVKGQGRVLRKTKNAKEFSRRSAEEAFRSIVKTHDKYGWVTPALSDG